MEVIQTFVVKVGESNALLFKCGGNRGKGRWFLQTTGAKGSADMKLKNIGPKAAAELLEPEE